MRPVCIALILTFVLPFSLMGQDVDKWLETYQLLDKKYFYLNPADAAKAKKYKHSYEAGQSFLKLLNKIKQEKQFQAKLSGEIGGSINSNNSPKSSTTDSLGATIESLDKKSSSDISAGIKLSRGFYPGRLEMNAQIGVRVNDGEFSENVSALKISYDHYIDDWLEGYVFVDRVSNDFLSIDQRYEVGGGIVVDWHPFEWPWEFDSISLIGDKNGENPIEFLSNNDTLLAKSYPDEPKWLKNYLIGYGELLNESAKAKVKVDKEKKKTLEKISKIKSKLERDGTSQIAEEPVWLDDYMFGYKELLDDSEEIDQKLREERDRVLEIWKRNQAARNQIDKPKRLKEPAWLSYYLLKYRELLKNTTNIDKKVADEKKRVLKELKKIESARKRAVNSIKKRHSRLRIAGLFGAFNELEKASIATDNETFSLDGTQQFRIEIRPTIEAQLTRLFSIRADWYFKWALENGAEEIIDELKANKPESLSMNEVNQLIKQAEAFVGDSDLRTDLQISLKANLAGTLGKGSKMSLSLSVRRQTDSIPPFWLNHIAREKNDSVRLKFSVGF